MKDKSKILSSEQDILHSEVSEIRTLDDAEACIFVSVYTSASRTYVLNPDEGCDKTRHEF